MTSTDIVKWRKTNDYENFEKGMIYMKILKKGGGGNEIHAPCACGFYCYKKKQLVKRKTDLTVYSCMLKYIVGMFFFAECLHA